MTDTRKRLAERMTLAINHWRQKNAWRREGRLPRPAPYRELAEALGVDPSLITCWRTGKSFPLPDRLAEVAETLGVPIGWFWSDDPLPEAVTK